MATHECNQRDKIEETVRKVDKIDQILFLGNGQKPITVQIEVVATNQEAMRKDLESIKSIGKALIIALLTLIGTTVWQLIQKHNFESGTHKQSEVAKWTP